jgi:hypothetical protein
MVAASPTERNPHLARIPKGEVDQMRGFILAAIGAAAAIVVMTPMAASAACGPVKDTSVKGDPHVYVN